MTRKAVVSLYDYTGEAVRPWAEAGYTCYCLDVQHPEGGPVIDAGDFYGETDGVIWKIKWDRCIGPKATLERIRRLTRGMEIVFAFGFPVCTDLAASGARYWAQKGEADPQFQTRAAGYAVEAAWVFEQLGCPFMIENPAGRLSTLWRKADHSFDPCDFGGYLNAGEPHPYWPDYIPAQDAYTKRTMLWTGGAFTMPERKPVQPVFADYVRKDGTTTRGAPQWGRLGGKSTKTKNIRSATPRGFARAVFEAHQQKG